MSREIEIKIRVPDPSPVQACLRELGAACRGRVLETSYIYDTPDRRLLSTDRGLRVRSIVSLGSQTGSARGASATLTFKGPRREHDVHSGASRADLKSREELEVTVGQAAKTGRILERLGYQPVIVYEKERETWDLERCRVTVDHLPQLGWWLEIEGPTPDAIQAVRAQLSLSQVETVHETYVEMAAARGEPDDAGCRRLRFTPGPGTSGRAWPSA